MSLRDHFHPPLSQYRHWHAFHNAWATYIAADLNHRLPAGYFAEPNVQFGIEIDVAAFEEPDHNALPTATDTWQAPPPACSVPFDPTGETVEINIFHAEAGPVLSGVIELVSPANKDRAAHRDAFIAKCEAYLQQGLGLVVVDVVTSRNANLHQALMTRLAAGRLASFETPLYAVAYRVVKHHEQPGLDIWPYPLTVGQALPTVPLWLQGELCLPLALDATYELTCREQRISVGLSTDGHR